MCPECVLRERRPAHAGAREGREGTGPISERPRGALGGGAPWSLARCQKPRKTVSVLQSFSQLLFRSSTPRTISATSSPHARLAAAPAPLHPVCWTTPGAISSSSRSPVGDLAVTHVVM